MFGRSHFMFVARLGQELAERGHEVMIFVGSSQRYAASNPNVRFFNDSKALAAHTPPTAEERKTISTRAELAFLYIVQSWYCDGMLSNVDLMKEVSRADLIVGEFLYLCSSLIADKLSLPNVILSASSLSAPTAFAFRLPFSPSYVPQLNVHLSDEWSILDRVRNLLQWMLNYVSYAQDLCSLYGNIKAKHNVTPDKSIHETLGRVDLIIGQMHFGLEHPRPLYPNTRVVGPFLPSPAKPLPNELEQFMQSAGDKGVILVSFGTVLGEYMGVNETLLQVMAEAFSKLPQKVIWKLKLDGTFKLSVSNNVKLMSWLPQNDILGHPKTRLFIGHAGINGILETTYHAVPIICSPFFGDQFDNAHKAKRAGFGEVVDLEATSSEEFVTLIRKVLGQPSYRESAARMSKSVKLLPRPPVKEAADWMEYAQAQGGLQFLRPRGLDLPFYQLYCLDIMLLAFLILAAALFVTRSLIKLVMRSFSETTKKEKVN